MKTVKELINDMEELNKVLSIIKDTDEIYKTLLERERDEEIKKIQLMQSLALQSLLDDKTDLYQKICIRKIDTDYISIPDEEIWEILLKDLTIYNIKVKEKLKALPLKTWGEVFYYEEYFTRAEFEYIEAQAHEYLINKILKESKLEKNKQ